jgi:hypothetical protein
LPGPQPFQPLVKSPKDISNVPVFFFCNLVGYINPKTFDLPCIIPVNLRIIIIDTYANILPFLGSNLGFDARHNIHRNESSERNRDYSNGFESYTHSRIIIRFWALAQLKLVQ